MLMRTIWALVALGWLLALAAVVLAPDARGACSGSGPVYDRATFGCDR